MLRKIATWTVNSFYALCLIFILSAVVYADQSNTWSPTTGTVSGLQLTTNFNNAFKAIQTCNSGATAPNNDISGGPVKGQCWLDTSTTPNTFNRYDGASWTVQGYIDVSAHLWLPVTGAGAATIASATTTDIGANKNFALTISGVTTITSLGSTNSAGNLRSLTFSGSLTLTHNAVSLILPNAGSNIVTAAGDTALAISLGSGNWKVITYSKADGSSLSANANLTAAVAFTGDISPSALGAGATDDYAPAGLSTAETLRLTPVSTSMLTGLTGGSDGRQITIYNISTSVILTIGANVSSSTAANRFQLAVPLRLYPDQSAQFRYDATSSRWRMVSPLRATSIPGASKNLRVFNDSGAPTTTMDVTADAITVEDAGGNAYRLNGVSIAPVITSSGANGLDAGTIASSTFYSLNVIYSPTTNTTAGLISTQTDCLLATLPAGYTACAHAAMVKVDANGSSSRFYRTTCYRDQCQYALVAATNTIVYPPIATGTSAGSTWAAVTIGGSSGAAVWIPTTAKSIFASCIGGNTVWSGLNPNNIPTPGATPTNTNMPIIFTQGNSSVPVAYGEMLIETANTVYYEGNAAGVGCVAIGWKDSLTN